jgi:aldose 1-epimerase
LPASRARLRTARGHASPCRDDALRLHGRHRGRIEPSAAQIQIEFSDQRAEAIEVGGGLGSYSANGEDVVDGFGPGETSTSGRGQLLIPWPNRLEDGSYEFDGRRHQLPLTEPEHRNAIHGLVRGLPWAVRERSASRVVLSHDLTPQPGYPFSLALTVEYALSAEGLLVRTTATNVGAEACPYGCGAHPYLTVGTETVDSVELRVPARTVLLSDERGLPVSSAPVEEAGLDFRPPRPIGETILDHAFADLERDEDGLARVRLRDPDSGAGVTLWVDESYGYVMLFTGDPLPDVARRSLAVEPMTCPPNAFRSGVAVVRLEPGASWTGAWGIQPATDASV